MKVKAVIMRPDHTNDVIVLKKKQIQGKTFTYDNETYFIHPDRFQFTWYRPGYTLGLARKYYTTYYFTKGHPQALPVPDFKLIRVGKEAGENGSKDPNAPEDGYKYMYDNGISAEELAAIFNPWFYRTIAAQTRSMWEQIQMILNIGTALGVGYLIYALATGHFKLPVP